MYFSDSVSLCSANFLECASQTRSLEFNIIELYRFFQELAQVFHNLILFGSAAGSFKCAGPCGALEGSQ